MTIQVALAAALLASVAIAFELGRAIGRVQVSRELGTLRSMLTSRRAVCRNRY